MTDEIQPALPEQQSTTPMAVPQAVIPPPRKPSNNFPIIVLGLVGAVGVLCLCSVACIAAIVLGLSKVAVEKAPVESVLDAYMEAMAAKDTDAAYALFSPRAQRQIPISEIQELIEGNNYILFEGYLNLSVHNLNISAVAYTNPDVPQGTVARVTGTLDYEEGIQGTFNATLEKIDGTWQIDAMYVSVPPNKIK